MKALRCAVCGYRSWTTKNFKGWIDNGEETLRMILMLVWMSKGSPSMFVTQNKELGDSVVVETLLQGVWVELNLLRVIRSKT